MRRTASCCDGDESQKVDSSLKAYCFGKMMPTDMLLNKERCGGGAAGPVF